MCLRTTQKGSSPSPSTTSATIKSLTRPCAQSQNRRAECVRTVMIPHHPHKSLRYHQHQQVSNYLNRNLLALAGRTPAPVHATSHSILVLALSAVLGLGDKNLTLLVVTWTVAQMVEAAAEAVSATTKAPTVYIANAAWKATQDSLRAVHRRSSKPGARACLRVGFGRRLLRTLQG